MSVSVKDGVSPVFNSAIDKRLFCRPIHYYRFKAFRDVLLLFDYNSSDLDYSLKFKHIVYDFSEYYAVEQHVFIGDYDLGVVVVKYPDPCYAVFQTFWSWNEWVSHIIENARRDVIFHNIFLFDAETVKEYGTLRLIGDLRVMVRRPTEISDVDDIPVDIFAEWLRRHGYFDDYMRVSGRIPWVIGRALRITPFVVRGIVDKFGFHNVFTGLVSELSANIRMMAYGYHVTFRGLRVRPNSYWVIDPVIKVRHRRLGSKEVRLRGEYVISFHVTP